MTNSVEGTIYMNSEGNYAVLRHGSWGGHKISYVSDLNQAEFILVTATFDKKLRDELDKCVALKARATRKVTIIGGT